MKKVLFLLNVILLGTLFFSCASLTLREKVEVYYPIKENTRYYYDGAGEGAKPYEVYNDYSSDHMVQQRMTTADGVKVAVLVVNEEGIRKSSSVEERYFRENLLKTSFDPEEILLMAPVEAGTSWTLKDGRVRTIVNVGTKLTTPSGNYKAVEVVTEKPGSKTIEYYANGVGLVKSVTITGDQEVSYTLSKIETDASVVKAINFFYPDFSDRKIYERSQNVAFRTNDDIAKVLGVVYKNILQDVDTIVLSDRTESDPGVLTENTEINSIDVYPEPDSSRTVHVDMNRAFIEELELHSLDEGLVLQSLANTFGELYQSDEMKLTIDGGIYKSDHIKLELWQTVSVLYENYPYYYDVIVYGGTASGVMAAISAAREGADVAILEQGKYLGGMVSGGLGYTDRGNTDKIGGLAREFFERIGQHYDKDISWTFEPRVAEEVLREMIKESGVDVYFKTGLELNGGIGKMGSTITGLITGKENTFIGQVYIDCSYEGDLMANAGVTYTYGREGADHYLETLAGIRPGFMGNNFTYPVNGYKLTGELYPGISDEPLGPRGEGDNKIQAYTYRLCLTDNPNNRAPFMRPLNYDPEKYELLLQWINTLKTTENGRNIYMADLMFLGYLPNGKVDVNNSGPFSTDYIGGSWDYPEADSETRDRIKKEHRDYLQGLLYFLSSDERVPIELRIEMSNWGYAKDEFVKNGYWPYQLYVREARRMVGDFVLTQQDLQEKLVKYDSVGMGTYNIDSHNTQRIVAEDGTVQNEGDIQVSVKPWQIPYRVLLPRVEEANNLLVPVCVSASHVAYSSLRMEPQYMILGEAAGVAARLAVRDHSNVQDISIPELRTKLIENGAVLE